LNRDDDSVEDIKDSALSIVIRNAESSRYLFRSTKYQKAPHDRFVLDLPIEDDNENMEVASDEETEVQPWLNDSEFLQKYRMSRKNFEFLTRFFLGSKSTTSSRNSKEEVAVHKLLCRIN